MLLICRHMLFHARVTRSERQITTIVTPGIKILIEEPAFIAAGNYYRRLMYRRPLGFTIGC